MSFDVFLSLRTDCEGNRVCIRKYMGRETPIYAHRVMIFVVKDKEVDLFVVDALFSTIKNVDFAEERLGPLIKSGLDVRKKAVFFMKKL